MSTRTGRRGAGSRRFSGPSGKGGAERENAPGSASGSGPRAGETTGASVRLIALGLLAVCLLVVWLFTSPVAQRWRLAQTPTDTLRVRAAARPNDLLLQIALADRLVSEGKGAEAVPLLERALVATGGAPEVAAALGEALAQAGRDEEAYQHLRYALARGPRADALRSLGALYLKHNRPDKALPELEQAVRVDPKSWESWRLLARARQREGTWTEAATALEKAVARHPTDTELRLDLAEALLESGRTDAAAEELTRVQERLRRTPWASAATRARHRMLLGRLHLEQEPFAAHVKEAEAALREALSLDASLVAARFALASLLLRADRPKEAEAEARELLRQQPSLLQARFLRARALAQMGRTGEAKREMEAFHRASEVAHQEMQLRGRLTLRPDDPTLHERLGRLLKEQGRAAEARAALEEARRLRRKRP